MTSSVCPSCGLVDADEGGGYCCGCGDRIAPAQRKTVVPAGSAVGEFVVLSTRDDDVIAESEHGSLRVLAFGREDEMVQECRALESLHGHRAFPSVDRLGEDPAHGPFLVLSVPPADARPLVDVAPSLRLSEAIAIASRTLAIADSLESKGLGWEPKGSDLFLRSSGDVFASRLRGAYPLRATGLEAKRVLEALGEALLPSPLVNGSSELVTLFTRSVAPGNEPHVSLVDAKRELSITVRVPVDSLPGVAELCHPGLVREHNEDATAIASGGSGDELWRVLVVCDGVSSSTHAEEASAIAARTARDALAHFASSGDIRHEGAASAMKSAIRAAHVAVCTTGIEHGNTAPPGTTIVAALIHRNRVTVGWIGDSRAYWVSPGGSELLTHDHSWVNETVARGEMSETQAMAAPLAHALTRCLGPLARSDGTVGEVEADIRVRPLPKSGYLVLCTDGLWNYYPTAQDLALLVRSGASSANAATIARLLVNHALARGGGDNVSVALCAHVPSGQGTGTTKMPP
jgi:PPM family protein phosphatase